MDRRHKLLLMRDILDHLNHSFDQWRSAEPGSATLLANTIERDLAQFRRLCDSMRVDAAALGPACCAHI